MQNGLILYVREIGKGWMMRVKMIKLIIIALCILTFFTPAFAADIQQLQAEGASMKYISAAIAFFGASIAAGLAIARAGSAGLAATAERPEVRTTAIIITALGEALGIYGIVIAIIILGA